MIDNFQIIVKSNLENQIIQKIHNMEEILGRMFIMILLVPNCAIISASCAKINIGCSEPPEQIQLLYVAHGAEKCPS